MAVENDFKEGNCRSVLSYACFKKAKELGADEVILYSNSILKPQLIYMRSLDLNMSLLGQAILKDRM